MDPLSFTASLFAVIGGAKAGAKGLRKIANYRHAPQEIAELLAELERFQALLQHTVTLVDEIDEETLKARGEVLAQEVEKSKEKIDSINRLLSEPNTVIDRLNEEKQARVKWMKNKKKIIAAQVDLKDSWVTINYALGILTASSTQSIRQSVNTSVTLGVANAEKLATLVDIIERTVQPPDVPRGEGNATGSQRVLATRSIDRSCSSSVDDEKGRSWQISSAKSRRCKPWCSCCCHCHKTFITPCLMTSVLGHFVLEYASTGSTKCNEYSCLRSKATSINLNYNLPQYLSAHFLSLTMDYTPITGTQFSIRIPRVMDWDHLLWMYANQRNVGAIQKMFSEGKASPLDINLLGETALFYAARGVPHPRLYQFLVEQGASQELADNNGYKPNELIGERLLSAEVHGEDAYTINKMLDETDFMETRRFTILHKIVLRIVRRSLREELEISTALINTTCIKGRTPLAWATIRDDLDEVATLLEFGANPNMCDNAGDSCLHFVRSPQVCAKLLEEKANVHLINQTYGASSLQSICKRIDVPEIIGLLHEAGADVNFQDDDGESALMNAIWKKSTGSARRLIELGADVNAANKSSGDTPLHFAVSISHHEIIPFLLEHDADYSTTTKRNATMAHMAAQFAEPETIKALAAFDLRNLDLSIRCDRGLTAEDYLDQRDFFAAPETEIRQAFEMLVQSIGDSKATSNRSPTIGEPVESQREGHLPGAYPT